MERFVTLRSFDYATRASSIEIIPEDVAFEKWTCVYFGKEVQLQESITIGIISNKGGVGKSIETQDLCCFVNKKQILDR